MKKLILSVISFIAFAFMAVSPGYALDEKLKITLTDLPDYKNTTEFRVYYTYFDTLGKTANVNLFIEKDGNGFRQTIERNKTAVSGYFQIQGSDVYDGSGKYNFYASAVTDGMTENSGTISTIIDSAAPGNVTDYRKERISATDYKLYWKCPSDEDVQKTYIYRSKDTSFTADSGTRIQEVFCNKEESKTTVVVGDADVEYYFALRAIDRAGNASGVITDAPGTVIAGQVAGTATEVKILPKETGQGGEAGEEGATQEGQLDGGISTGTVEEGEGQVKGEETSAFNKKYLYFGLPILGLLALVIYLLRRKK